MANAQPTAAPKPKSATKLTKEGKASALVDDAVSLLMADHRKVEDLFRQYEKAKDDPKTKQAIFTEIHAELKVHMALEEELFYPASRPFVDEQDTVNEAEVEHTSCKDLMSQLAGMSPKDAYYDAKVKVLSEFIEHHVEEEETEYFPECRRSPMDLKTLGEQMKARKAELTGVAKAN